MVFAKNKEAAGDSRGGGRLSVRMSCEQSQDENKND